MILLRSLGLAPALVFLCGCAVQQAEVAERGRSELVGLSQNELRMCAGAPANVTKVRGGEIWMYEHGATNPSDVHLLQVLPYMGLAPPEGANGYCRVQLRFARDRVAEVSYAGATDLYGARDAVCAPMINTCLQRRQAALAARQ